MSPFSLFPRGSANKYNWKSSSSSVSAMCAVVGQQLFCPFPMHSVVLPVVMNFLSALSCFLGSRRVATGDVWLIALCNNVSVPARTAQHCPPTDMHKKTPWRSCSMDLARSLHSHILRVLFLHLLHPFFLTSCRWLWVALHLLRCVPSAVIRAHPREI